MLSSSTAAAGMESTCDHSGIAANTRKAAKCFRMHIGSRDYDGIAWLEFYILLGILALDDFSVVERKTRLGTIAVLLQYINRLLLGIITEATGKCNGVENGCRVDHQIRTGLRSLTK